MNTDAGARHAAVQRRSSEWDLGKVARVMARMFVYLLYLPHVVRGVLGAAIALALFLAWADG